MITFSSNPQMVSDKLPEIFSAFNRPVISQKQVPQKDKDTDVAILNKKGNNNDANTQKTKPIISQPKKKLGFWKNLGAATVGYFGMKIPANISVKVLNKGFLNKMLEVSSDLSKEDVIKKMKEASILFLPLSFDKKSAEYSRLSMLTKISEYLVSKTPILLYCPQDAAVSEYLRQHNAAFDSERGTDNIIETLKEIIENNEKRELITRNAYNLAYEKHRIEDVCERFRASFFSNKQRQYNIRS